MNIKDLIQNENFNVINNGNTQIKINNIFVGDLLSHVMGYASNGDILVTVLNNINVLGVASLLDFSGVIFAHGVKVNDEVIKKADELEIPLITTALSSADTVIELHKMGF